jgi:hypothetical protein
MTTTIIRRSFWISLLLALLFPVHLLADGARLQGMPQGSGTYDDLVALFEEFLGWRNADTGYDADTIIRRQTDMENFQARIADMAVADWDLNQQVDYLAVRSRFDQYDFRLRVSRPWSRDPGFYADQMQRITFTALPLEDDGTAELRRRLTSIVELSKQAQQNLTEVAADYADLAIHNLRNADGVGHGFPYRATPPRGVIGWYDDLLARAEKQQPELVDDIATTRQAVESFYNWLVDGRPTMTAAAGDQPGRYPGLA